jgi:hypothetical protein
VSWLRDHLSEVAPLLLVAAVLLALRDLEARPWATVLVFAAAVAAFAFALRRLGGSTPPASAVLGVAALLRICLLPLPPTLSDDVYRYLWDGRIASAGRNPYFHAPEDRALTDLRDERWERVAHRDVETVYPPLAVAAFSIAARSPRPVLAWKAMLAVIDLLSCGLLLRLARARDAPSGRCLAYAWNPLVVLEVAGMGHVDALGVLPLVAGALLLVEPGYQRRPRLVSLAAGAALSLAVLAKLVPVLLVPAWTRAAPRRALFVVAGAALVVVAVAPFAIGAPGLPPGLVTYAVSWEWNGPLFEPLWRGLDRAGAAPFIKDRLDDLKQVSGRDELWNRFYPFVYPQLLAKILLAVALGGCVLASLRRSEPIGAAFLVFAAVLVLSATVYPWYALWVLPWAALGWRLPWLVLSLSLLASYLPRLLDVPLLPWPFLLVWAPFLIAVLWTRRAAARAAANRVAAPPTV